MALKIVPKGKLILTKRSYFSFFLGNNPVSPIENGPFSFDLKQQINEYNVDNTNLSTAFDEFSDILQPVTADQSSYDQTAGSVSLETDKYNQNIHCIDEIQDLVVKSTVKLFKICSVRLENCASAGRILHNLRIFRPVLKAK